MKYAKGTKVRCTDKNKNIIGKIICNVDSRNYVVELTDTTNNFISYVITKDIQPWDFKQRIN